VRLKLKDRVIDFLYDRSTFILILVFIILIGTVIIVPPASARCEVLSQGDFVYLNETCDVSRVLSWGGMFAHFSSDYYGETPDRVVNVTGFMFTHKIDPAKYVVGNWFKWDGEYEDNSNPLAFRVKAGIRPNLTVNKTTNVTPNTTPTITASPYNTKTTLVIARGEVLPFEYATGDKGKAWIWLFEGSNDYLGMPMEQIEWGYKYGFTKEITQSFPPDTYTAFIQFAGYNKKQDVYYSQDNTFLSVYRDVKPVSLNGLSNVQYSDKFIAMVTDGNYSDDTIIPLTITIKDPAIAITDYYQRGDNLIVEGTTTLSLKTSITCIVDPEHWVTQKEKNENTYPVYISGDIDEDREFSVSLPIRWDELSIGEHLIVLTAKKDLINLTVHKEFDVTDTFVMPTPRPEKVKILLDKEGKPLLIPTPTPTPEPTFTPEPTPIPTPEPTIIPNVTINTTPTPLPIKTPKPTPTMMTLSLPINISIVAICLAFAKFRGVI
jgi:hypothetical protein